MKKILDIIRSNPLFENMEDFEIIQGIETMNYYTKNYRPGDYIIKQGDNVTNLGIILSGLVQIEKVDIFGKNNIFTVLKSGDIFSETFVAANVEIYPTSAVSKSDTDILFLDFNRLTGMCNFKCLCCSKLNRNMMKILANKNRFLRDKLELTSLPSLRDKILFFLSQEARNHESNCFDIDFNRNQLAEYLNVNRSALSRELSNLKNEGVIDYYKNSFKLIN